MAGSVNARVHHNLIAITADWGDRVRRLDGAVLVAARSEMPFMNGVLRERAEGDAGELLAQAREFFFGLERGFVVFTWPGDTALLQAAEQAGMFPVVERYPEMVCRGRLDSLPSDVQ